LTSRYIDATAINRQFRIAHDTKDNRAANTADCRSFLFHKQERLLAGQQAPRSTAADDVPAVAEIFGFAPWEYHSPAFEIAQRRLSFIELVSRRMIELSIVDLWTSKILFSDRESMLVVTQMSD
jgi:hypothetical protein